MSRINIFPPVALVYPNDRVKFTAQSLPPPAMWAGVSDSGDIKSDFSLEVDPAGSTTSGGGAHRLFSGLGIVEFTIDNQCLPTSTNTFQINGFINDVNGFQYIYNIRIAATTVKVFDETASEIFTESYSSVAGDIYRLELSAGFRLYRNGVLKHSRVNLGTTVVYPMTYQAVITEATVSAPTRIPQPRLIGDWRLGPVVAWTAPSHGSISNPAGEFIGTDYFGGTIPGTYTLTGAIAAAFDAGNVQRATATIIIPPLQILGSTNITLLPGQKARFKTNYDAAQTALITWSVVVGQGSFSQGEFTAGSNPGITIVRATASVNGLSADITINVPALITNASGFTAAKVNEQIDFDTNLLITPIFVAAGVTAAGTGNVLPGIPPGAMRDDIHLVLIESANEAAAISGGWTAVADSPQGTGTAGGAASARITAFYRRADLTEVPPTITDPGDHAMARIYSFRGCINTGSPWDVTSGDVAAAATTAVSIPGDTTTVVNCLIALIVAHGTDTGSPEVSGYTNGDLTSLTEIDDINHTNGNGGGIGLATGIKATAGSYGATTATLVTSSVQGRMSIALKPAVPVWSASIGSINSSSGIWTAPSLAGQTARITVTNGTFTIILEIPVLEAFPFTDFILPVTWDRNLTALVGMSEDRSNRITREKAPAFDSYPVKLAARSLTESNALDAFFDAHGFGKPFILEDKVRNIRKVGWFDSKIAHEARDECDIDLAFQFLEARL